MAPLVSWVFAYFSWVDPTHGWCDPDSWLQGHAAWHLLGAVAAYFLFRLYESEHVLERRLSSRVHL